MCFWFAGCVHSKEAKIINQKAFLLPVIEEKQLERLADTETEKRMIHVSMFVQQTFLIIRFENYCEGELDFEQNLPVTTKKQAEFHGYGLKSLRHTVHKYGGEVDIDVEDQWFRLKILIPM